MTPRSFYLPGLCLALAAGAAPAAEGVTYLHRIRSAQEFERLSIPERSLPGVDRITKFLVPARDDPSLLPAVFQDVNLYPLHQEFLVAEFPDRFPGLDGREYVRLVERRATRSYFAGTLFRFPGNPGPTYAFDVFTLAGDRGELPAFDEALWIFRQLRTAFELGPVAYAPRDPDAIEAAKGWAKDELQVNFAFGDLGELSYFAYTAAANFGRIRVFTAAEFQEANESGGFGSQDIVVVEEAPADIEGVIAGVITGGIQSELGHLAIRTARRGTPNAFVRGALEAFRPHDGKLVLLEVSFDGYQLHDATLPEAEAWWAAHRPNLASQIVAMDEAYEPLDAAGAVDLDVPGLRPTARYGGKSANFLRLYTFLPEVNRVPGFAVPFRYYLEFLEANRTPSLADPARRVTFAEYIAELLADPGFRGDSRTRFAALEELRERFEDDGEVDAELVAALHRRIEEVFGGTDRKVRFRSSSNAEDLLEFNGAGLYSSTSACAADDLDAGSGGPSRCDPAQEDERGVARALKRVWGSLWNFRAYEEREYFQIPHDRVGMAILVSDAFPDERANGVAFTGNPARRGDRRFLVNAQIGDNEVVFTDPGVVAEKDVLEMADGQVARILRVRPSSLVPEGTFVLEDDHLRELGSLLALVESQYPLELGGHARDEVLLDFEFKLDRNTDRIRLKQVRPFLIADTGAAPAPEFRLTVPGGMTACASFRERWPNERVLEAKLRVGLRAGASVVRAGGSSAAELFEWLETSPSGPRVAPSGPGIWLSEPVPGVQPATRYRAHQDFRVDGKLVRVALRGLTVPNAVGEVTLDPPALTWGTSELGVTLEATQPESPPPDGQETLILPCDPVHLPLHTVDVAFFGGGRVRFEERFQFVTVGTGPAELVTARVQLAGQEQVVSDYWRLVYTAGHHNDFPYPELWAILDPPIDVPGAGRVKVVGVAQGFSGDEPAAYFLGEDFSELHRPEIVLFRRQAPDAGEVPQFRRGDVNGSGSINVSDPIAILLHLFRGGALLCPDAADFDDFGSVEWDDAILLLRFLFLGLDAPAPPGPRRCGEDGVPDDLPRCDGVGCR